MSEPRRTRQRPASPEQVDLYRVLTDADKPLTVDEIADRIAPIPAWSDFAERSPEWTYQDVAELAYEEAVIAPVLRAGRGLTYDDYADETAWRRDVLLWWVGRIVNTARIKRRVIVTTPDGSSTVGKRRGQLRYEANYDNAPTG